VYARVARDPDHVRIRLGTLDREADAEITAHVWVGSMGSPDLDDSFVRTRDRWSARLSRSRERRKSVAIGLGGHARLFASRDAPC
jgi:hypothetical protein